MPQMENIAKMIRSYYDLAGAPILALVLLILEKLMETEFVCPSDKAFGIIYSLMFIVGTTAILSMFVCSCWCKCCGTQHDNGDLEEGPCSYQECKDSKCGCCCTESCYKRLMSFKAPVFWLLILVTDGRYFECLVRSIDGSNVNTTTGVKGFILQIIQVTGLGLILIGVILLLCKCGKKSEHYQKMHKEAVLRSTKKVLEERRKQKLEAFVNQSINVEHWNPKLLSAEETWRKISKDHHEGVERNLEAENKTRGQISKDHREGVERNLTRQGGALQLSDLNPTSPK